MISVLDERGKRHSTKGREALKRMDVAHFGTKPRRVGIRCNVALRVTIPQQGRQPHSSSMLLLTEYSGCTIAMGRLQFRDSHSATDPSPSCVPGCAGQERGRLHCQRMASSRCSCSRNTKALLPRRVLCCLPRVPSAHLVVCRHDDQRRLRFVYVPAERPQGGRLSGPLSCQSAATHLLWQPACRACKLVALSTALAPAAHA